MLGGVLTWARDVSVGRTAVVFTLTLSLDHYYYPNVSVASIIPLPGLLHYGDNSELDDAVMMMVLMISCVSLCLKTLLLGCCGNPIIHCCRGNSTAHLP